MPADQMTRAKVAARRTAVLAARAAGLRCDQMPGVIDGVTDARMAARDLKAAIKDQQALAALSGDDRASLLAVELAGLGAQQRAVEAVMRRAAAEQGKGNSDDMVLRATGRLLQIGERRQLLLGLTVPEQRGGGEDELARRRRQLHARRAG